jgi:hypothetical protein
MNPVFIYDGSCSFCSKLATYWKSQTDSKLAYLSFSELSEAELQSIHPSLSKKICASDVQLIVNGKRLPGFFGIRRMMFWTKKFRWIAPFLYLPLIPLVGILVMMVLKAIRNKL